MTETIHSTSILPVTHQVSKAKIEPKNMNFGRRQTWHQWCLPHKIQKQRSMLGWLPAPGELLSWFGVFFSQESHLKLFLLLVWGRICRWTQIQPFMKSWKGIYFAGTCTFPKLIFWKQMIVSNNARHQHKWHILVWYVLLQASSCEPVKYSMYNYSSIPKLQQRMNLIDCKLKIIMLKYCYSFITLKCCCSSVLLVHTQCLLGIFTD